MALTRAHDYCPTCGSDRLLWRVPPGDDRERQMCDTCGAIHYHNPRNVAGCIGEHDGRILLCRRAIEPRRGFWTVPAGFMENGESLVAAAMRETVEEALAVAEQPELYAVFNLPHINQVYVLFRAGVRDGAAAAGHESLEVAWFGEGEIPWDELAFPVVHEGLRLYLADRQTRTFPVHMGDIMRREDGHLVVRHHDGSERGARPDWRRGGAPGSQPTRLGQSGR
jgi:ADP-ribose pyrophosphatase YjhB (NUDIX family)